MLWKRVIVITMPKCICHNSHSNISSRLPCISVADAAELLYVLKYISKKKCFLGTTSHIKIVNHIIVCYPSREGFKAFHEKNIL